MSRRLEVHDRERSSSWFLLTQNFANKAMVRSAISCDGEMMIDVWVVCQTWR